MTGYGPDSSNSTRRYYRRSNAGAAGKLATSFYVWNSRQKKETLAIGLITAGAVIVVVLIAVVAAL